MKLAAGLAVAFGLLVQIAAVYFFALRAESPQFLPMIAVISLGSALEAAGLLVYVRR